MRRVGILLVVAAVAAQGAAVGLAVQSPRALQSKILTAARSQRSVHYVVTNHANNDLRQVCDVASDRGIQRVSFTPKGGNTGHVTILVVGHTAYLRGDVVGLHAYMRFSPLQASRYHDRWISVPHRSPAFKGIAAAVTLPSFVADELDWHGSLVRVSGKVDGRAVIGVRRTGRVGGLRTIQTLYGRAHGRPLPVAVTQVAPTKGYRANISTTHWNEPVRVAAPAHTVPIATVLATS